MEYHSTAFATRWFRFTGKATNLLPLSFAHSVLLGWIAMPCSGIGIGATEWVCFISFRDRSGDAGLMISR